MAWPSSLLRSGNWSFYIVYVSGEVHEGRYECPYKGIAKGYECYHNYLADFEVHQVSFRYQGSYRNYRGVGATRSREYFMVIAFPEVQEFAVIMFDVYIYYGQDNDSVGNGRSKGVLIYGHYHCGKDFVPDC